MVRDGQYFVSYIGNQFLRIKHQILGKNGESKVVHLIYGFYFKIPISIYTLTFKNHKKTSFI